MGNLISKIFFNRIGIVVLGVLITGLGVVAFGSGEVTCGSRTMHQGDICTTISRGSSVDRTYDEEKSRDNLFFYGFLAVGGALVIGGIVANVRHYTRRTADPAAPATM